MLRVLLSACLGLGAALVVAEVALQVLPVSSATMSGYQHDPDLLTYPSHHQWRMATGWDLRNPQTLHSNNWGFAATHDFSAGTNAVALIGDSYVEASMLDAGNRPAAQLETLLSQRMVYAMGTPGTALLDYAQRIRFAHERFGTKDFVVLLERFDARQSLCGSGNVVSRCLDPTTLAPRIERRPPASGLKRWLRHSALAQYLTGQLRIQPAAILKAMFTRRTPEALAAEATPRAFTDPTPAQIANNRKMVDAVIDEFFATAGQHVEGKLVFVVDGRRGGPASRADLSDIERTYLMQRLRDRRATVYDMEPLYAAHAASSPRSLDVGPYDGHLNPTGVHLVMAQAAQAFRATP